jgi:site-specific DNA recombinase
MGLNDVLKSTLRNLMAQRDDLLAREAELRSEPDHESGLPTIDEIKREARESIVSLPSDSPEFGRLMHRLIPRFQVYPYQLCDGGAVVLRAKLTLDLTTLAKLDGLREEVKEVLRRELTVDLFDPPQRVRFREQVVAMREAGMTEVRVAQSLGITITAAQRAATLHRIMQFQNLSDPYVAVTAPPADCTKLRRHLHPRYRFEPLDNGPE